MHNILGGWNQFSTTVEIRVVTKKYPLNFGSVNLTDRIQLEYDIGLIYVKFKRW